MVLSDKEYWARQILANIPGSYEEKFACMMFAIADAKEARLRLEAGGEVQRDIVSTEGAKLINPQPIHYGSGPT